jgi:hypothetical protein
VDLPAMWEQLGIVRDGDTVRFVDTAPLAAIREAITYGTPAVPRKAALNALPQAILLGRRKS